MGVDALIEHQTTEFRAGRELQTELAEPLLDALIVEENEAAIGDLLTAWAEKGTSANELFDLASVMRRRCRQVISLREPIVDSVGTGGSRAKTFNVSTAAAFAAAGADVAVAKHGNRAATSRTGSADVLETMGIVPAVDADRAELCLNTIGICFMFAPVFHRLSPTLARVRRSIPMPTAFNFLGPLCNPASAPHQLIGVSRPEMLRPMADALSKLGTTFSWVVHGSDGLDEITLSGSTRIAEVSNGSVREFEVDPSQFGSEQHDISHLAVTTAKESGDIVLGVLRNELNGEPADLVIINAAAAIYVAGKASSLVEAARKARQSIETGNALEKVRQLAEATK